MKTLPLVVLWAMALTVARLRGHAMATEQIGPDPAGQPTVAQPGWPKGTVDLARHACRVYSVWVNGNEHFYFKASAAQVEELVALFSKLPIRDHRVRVLPGAGTTATFTTNTIEYNVALQVVTGIALIHALEEQQKGTPANLPLEPLLTLHAGGMEEVLRGMRWPSNTIVECIVPGMTLVSPETLPERKIWYGRLEFSDGAPVDQFVRHRITAVTLWQQGSGAGIGMGNINYRGHFAVALSAEELADLRTGKTWLTLTTGDWRTEPRAEDARFPVELLAPTAGQARPVAIVGAKNAE